MANTFDRSVKIIHARRKCFPVVINVCGRFHDDLDKITEPILKFININSARCGQNRDFACANGNCVPFTSVCDGIAKCEDGSDEENALCIDENGENLHDLNNFYTYFITVTLTVMTICSMLTESNVQRIYTYIYTIFTNNESQYVAASFYPLDTPEKFKIRRNDFRIGPILGSGNFGIVFSGNYSRIENNETVETAVALKTCACKHISSLQNDLRILIHINIPEPHPNIVELIGCSFEGNGQLYILMEVCDDNLLTYLRYLEQSGEILLEEALSDISLGWIRQMVEGMDYLVSKRIIHRDVAARNILVSGNHGENIKISDFGMSIWLAPEQNSVTLTPEQMQQVPVTHCAIEVLMNAACSEKSDVWAFGVTLWEILTLGLSPYNGDTDAESILRSVPLPVDIDNYHNEEKVQEIYQMMRRQRRCWLEQPINRPTFAALKEFFNNFELEGVSTDVNFNYL